MALRCCTENPVGIADSGTRSALRREPGGESSALVRATIQGSVTHELRRVSQKIVGRQRQFFPEIVEKTAVTVEFRTVPIDRKRTDDSELFG